MEAALKPKRVVLVDDHPTILHQIGQLLPDEFEIVGTLRDGTRLEAMLAATAPDLIVLDVTLPGMSGIALARRLTAAGCPASIVFLTVHSDADYAREALAAGGIGYIVKARLGTDLLPALHAALAGQHFISPCPELEGLVPAHQPSPLINATPAEPSPVSLPQRNS